MKVIECKNVSKSYGRHVALANISVAIEENKITGLVGRNGAGKTTLLKLIAGFLKPTSGYLRVFSKPPFQHLQVAQNLIYIDDQLLLPTTLSLQEIVKEGSHFYPNWNMKLAMRLLDYFSLQRNVNHQGLSKGMKSTFHAILGIAARAPLTIFDEPTTGMDAAVRNDFYRILLKDYLEFPRTMIVSSHHIQEVEDILEDVLLLDQGTKRLHKSVDELKNYAIGISGSNALVEEWLKGKEVLFKKPFGVSETYAVVKREFPDELIHNSNTVHLRFSPVTLEDLCMYFTSKSQRGINDVYSDCENR